MHGAISRMGTLRADAPRTAGRCPWERSDRRDLLGIRVMRGHDVVLPKDRSHRPSNSCFSSMSAKVKAVQVVAMRPSFGFDRTANR